MTDRPIIFSAPMVRALLAGRKTQTRRLAHRNATAQSLWHRVERGDRLWVREGFVPRYFDDGRCAYRTDWTGESADVVPEPRWRPSIHMPRRASRITLTVTQVRRQRLQDITPNDAEAEGVFRHVAEWSLNKVFRDERGPTALRYFRDLWDQLHGAGSWDTNPEVIALTFTVERRNIDAPIAQAGAA